MGVINFGRVNVAKNKYGANNNEGELIFSLKCKLVSRDVDLHGVSFHARRGKKNPQKIIIDAFRGEKWIASANCDHNGNIVYSMPGTDTKK